MASVHKPPSRKSPFWTGVFADENGVQRYRSTKETDKTRAQEKAALWERAAKKLRGAKRRRGETPLPGSEAILELLIVAAQQAMEGKFTITHARRCIDQLLEIGGQPKIAAITTETFLTEWLATTKLTVVEGTYKSYEEKILGFLDFLGQKKTEPIDAVLPQDIVRYRKMLLDSKIAKTTINLKIKILSTPFREAQKMGYLAVNPCDLVKPLPARHAERKAFTLKQLRTLLAITDDDWRGMILVGASTGMRITDAASLKWKDVDLQRGTIVLYPEKKREREGAKNDEAVILPDLSSYLSERLQKIPKKTPNQPIFPSLDKRKTSGKTGLSLTFREIMGKAGIQSDIARAAQNGGKGRTVYELGFHSLRHSCTSIMANIGVSEEIRKKLVGHTSDVHLRYTHFELQTFRRELQNFPRLLSADEPGAQESAEKG